MDTKSLIGSPWRLLNLSDFIIIGLEATLFLLILQVLGMGWHRLNLLRHTGSASTSAERTAITSSSLYSTQPLVSTEAA